MIAAVAGAEAYVRRNVTANDSFDAQRARFHAGGFPVTAFGDSRIASGIVDSDLVANFATPGDNGATVLGKFEAYTRQNPGGRVILQAGPQQFSAIRLDADQSRLLADFVEPGSAPLQILRPHLRRFLVGFVAAAARNPSAVFSPVRTPETRRAPEPASFISLPSGDRQRAANERIQHHTPVTRFETNEIVRSWNRVIEAAVGNGAEICLVTMPVSRAYRDAAAQDPAFARARSFYRDLARSAGITYLDLWDGWPDDIFVNPDHVHPNAAPRVTRAIVEKCFGPDIAARLP